MRVPVAGATGGEVDGWTSTSKDDGEGRTVVEWTGGSLPTDVTGAFPVNFTVPDRAGELLLFPSVQTCENGEDWSWLNGDPESDNPVPRLLILPAGSPEAVSIDEVPLDAPGRDLLTAVVDTEPTTTTSMTSTTAPAAESTTTGATPTTTAAPESGTDDDAASTGSSAVALILVGGVAVVMLGGGLYLWRREK